MGITPGLIHIQHHTHTSSWRQCNGHYTRSHPHTSQSYQQLETVKWALHQVSSTYIIVIPAAGDSATGITPGLIHIQHHSHTSSWGQCNGHYTRSHPHTTLFFSLVGASCMLQLPPALLYILGLQSCMMKTHIVFAVECSSVVRVTNFFS